MNEIYGLSRFFEYHKGIIILVLKVGSRLIRPKTATSTASFAITFAA